jgi:uncharacterized pyridoxamine 5'-phosphate oxidase family protein
MPAYADTFEQFLGYANNGPPRSTMEGKSADLAGGKWSLFENDKGILSPKEALQIHKRNSVFARSWRENVVSQAQLALGEDAYDELEKIDEACGKKIDEFELRQATILRNTLWLQLNQFQFVFETSSGSIYFVGESHPNIRIRKERRSRGQNIVSQSERLYFVTLDEAKKIHAALKNNQTVTFEQRKPGPGLVPFEFSGVQAFSQNGKEVKLTLPQGRLQYHVGSSLAKVHRSTADYLSLAWGSICGELANEANP